MSFPYCISINSSYIYEQSTDERINQNDAAITLAHELGHYLGLRHVFSEGGPLQCVPILIIAKILPVITVVSMNNGLTIWINRININ
ncbi:M43 family zinc metalloprotease [Bacteroides thetaiotaomicron]|nr:M43 family zinc metalloprotease [Bacteroides thetaiotaomicron]